MKKIIVLLVAVMFLVCACADSYYYKGNKYVSYGFLNKDSKCNPQLNYELVYGNIFWSVILFETIIMPIYFIGFSIYEPVGLSDPEAPKGTDEAPDC